MEKTKGKNGKNAGEKREPDSCKNSSAGGGKPLSDEDKKTLFRAAEAARANAYAPYSEFKVGAALMTADGWVFTGVNIENSSYPVGLCAERSAFAQAVSAGIREFRAIAICGSGNEPCWPCGMCRQFMYEFAPDLPVITGSDEDHLEEVKLSELLTKGFTL